MVDREKQHPLMIVLFLLLEKERSGVAFSSVRACLHEGGGPQVGDVNVIKLKRETEWTCLDLSDDPACAVMCKGGFDFVRVTPLKRDTTPTWGPPPPCKQALRRWLSGCKNS